MISQRTKDALAALKAQGKKLGGIRPKTVLAMQAADKRAEALRPLFEELDALGLSANGKARELNARQIPTPRGKPWSAVTVLRVKARLGMEEKLASRTCGSPSPTASPPSAPSSCAAASPRGRPWPTTSHGCRAGSCGIIHRVAASAGVPSS